MFQTQEMDRDKGSIVSPQEEHSDALEASLFVAVCATRVKSTHETVVH